MVIVMEAFVTELRRLPVFIADNSDYDSVELASQLRAADAAGNSYVGLNMAYGCITNMEVLGITGFHNLNRLMIAWASKAVEMIIQVDKIMRAAYRKRQRLRS
ncbi:T-complex protein 1 subunit beta [Taenia solium]|eukprot:TsM_000957600 transcript=TsM_000957600 gene=TsM_000957600